MTFEEFRGSLGRDPVRGGISREQFAEHVRWSIEHGTPLEECDPAELALIAGVLGRVAREIAPTLPPDLREPCP